MPQVFPHEGDCVFCGVWTNLLTPRAFDTDLIKLPADVSGFVRYTIGGVGPLQVGEKLIGSLSGSKCSFIKKVIENGMGDGAADEGLILVSGMIGNFQAETLTGEITGATVVIAQDIIPVSVTNRLVRALFLSVEVGPIVISTDGTIPTKTVDGGLIHRLGIGQTYNMTGTRNISKFKGINSIHNNLAKMSYSLYY
jgi:hypothetical protein